MTMNKKPNSGCKNHFQNLKLEQQTKLFINGQINCLLGSYLIVF